MSRSFPVFLGLLALAGCAQLPPQVPAQTPAPTTATTTCPAPQTCPACPACPTVEPPKPTEKPLQAAEWNELTGWTDDDPSAAFTAFITSCRSLERQAHWKPVCTAAREVTDTRSGALRSWFESTFRPWALVNPDGSRSGLITGYYEPILKGSRQKARGFAHPVFGPP